MNHSQPAATVLVAGLLLTPALLTFNAGCSSSGSSSNSSSSTSGTVTQLSFASAEDAVQALHYAAANQDREYLHEIFGPEIDEISSGDAAQSARELAQFAASMDRRRDIVRHGDGTASIIIGDQGNEFPVPLHQVDGRWSFDTLAGVEAITDMRIDFNETRTIRFLQALPAAQQQYITADHNGDGVREYASKLLSSPGKHDGLYWPSEGDEPQSPLGPSVAEGDAEAARHSTYGYNGYLFKMLPAQGPAAPGGTKSYMKNGRLTEGFAWLAYPSEYNVTGVMTFIVGPDGKVYEKDCNEDFNPASVTAFDPGSGWEKIDGSGKSSPNW
ncbi:MAG: DUF2950 family protein [Phycisphaerales bacterium]|nr:DUF2950 family protein [Phycisphaerales bacterium]